MKPSLQQALAQQGYTTLTPVQTAVTDPETGAADLLVSAKTGSGKTVGFGLAIAPTIMGEADRLGRAGAPLALVIAPTRELAMQVRRELTWLYAPAGAVLASCVGGMDIRSERRALERGAHIVVATPGRLRDHILRGSIDLGAIRAVVLDEADEMLDLGFQEELEFILGAAPQERRTLMFSATVPPAIATLAQRYQKDARRIATTAEERQHSDIDYRAMAVGPRDAENAIINVLRYHEAPNALVFANTRATVSRLAARLANRGFQVVALSGELTQGERSNALQAMRDGRARVCVATDVAARGIDLPNLDLVIHAEVPGSPDTLLHRSGRTGRAGRKGVSVIIVPPAVRKKCLRVLGMAKVVATWADPPTPDMINARDLERMMNDPVWQEAVEPDKADYVARLVAAFSPEQLAHAYVSLYRQRHTAPEEIVPVAAQPRAAPRAPFGPGTWFSLPGGRKAGAEPRRIMPMLCKAGGLTGDDIGAIRVQFDRTFVEIRQSAVDGFLASLGSDMAVEGGVRLTRLDKAPDFSAPARDIAEPPRRKPTGKPKDQPAGKAPEKQPLAAKKSAAPKATPRKPRHKKTGVPQAAGKPPGKAPAKPKAAPKPDGAKRRTAPKGPPPPKGKASSKKNRARAAERKMQGGNTPPRRRTP